MSGMVIAYRNHLCLNDLAFVISILAADDAREANALLALLTDPNTATEILDQPQLFERVITSPDTLELSTRLYFYLLTRHTLKRSGLDCPDVADYIAGVLDAFVYSGFNPHEQKGVFYVVDWLKQLDSSPAGKHYELYVMAGNHLLFLTGIFPEFIEQRSRRRGAPTISFYETIASHSFRSAAEHPFSQKIKTGHLYREVAEVFPVLRTALNDLSDRLISID